MDLWKVRQPVTEHVQTHARVHTHTHTYYQTYADVSLGYHKLFSLHASPHCYHSQLVPQVQRVCAQSLQKTEQLNKLQTFLVKGSVGENQHN